MSSPTSPPQSAVRPRTSEPRTDVPEWLDLVVRRVAATDFGAVHVVVHDRRVVQVDWTQRSRFDAGRRDGAAE